MGNRRELLAVCVAAACGALASGTAAPGASGELERRVPAVVEGRVRAAGDTVPDLRGLATVTVLRDDGQRIEARTKVFPDGAYRVHVDPGHVEHVLFAVPGFPPLRRAVDRAAPAGGGLSVDAELDPGVAIEGRVFELGSGTGIPGVTVDLPDGWHVGGGTRTDRDGRFAFSAVRSPPADAAGHVELQATVRAGGFRLVSSEPEPSSGEWSVWLPEAAGGRYEVSIPIERDDATVRGVVVDGETGEPVEQATILVVEGGRVQRVYSRGKRGFEARGCARGPARAVAFTRPESRYHREGGRAWLEIAVPDSGWADVDLADGAADGVRLELGSTGGRIHGRVCVPGGGPASGWVVTAWVPGRSPGWRPFLELRTAVDGDGFFDFSDLPPLPYVLRADSPRVPHYPVRPRPPAPPVLARSVTPDLCAYPRNARVVLAPGEVRAVEFRVERPATFRGRVTAAADPSSPLDPDAAARARERVAERLRAGLRVLATPEGGPGLDVHVEVAPVAADGTFLLRDLAPLPHRLSLVGASGAVVAEARHDPAGGALAALRVP